MNRIELINSLIESKGYKSYLEIGVQSGASLKGVNCDYKVGVDTNPKSPASHHMTSRSYFRDNDECFDIIFIDGDHTYAGSFYDIQDAFMHLNEGGIIVCHDSLPWNESTAKPKPHLGAWCGEVYKALLRHAQEGKREFVTVDTDCGLALLTGSRYKRLPKKYKELPESLENLTFEHWLKNRDELMNVISVDKFKQEWL